MYHTSAEVTKKQSTADRGSSGFCHIYETCIKLVPVSYLPITKQTFFLFNMLQAQTIRVTHTAALWEENLSKAFVATLLKSMLIYNLYATVVHFCLNKVKPDVLLKDKVASGLKNYSWKYLDM